jgi:hypothetical protein
VIDVVVPARADRSRDGMQNEQQIVIGEVAYGGI